MWIAEKAAASSITVDNREHVGSLFHAVKEQLGVQPSSYALFAHSIKITPNKPAGIIIIMNPLSHRL